MYQTSFYIMDISDTYIYTDSLNSNSYISSLDLVSIQNLNSANMLFIKVKNSDDLTNFENVFWFLKNAKYVKMIRLSTNKFY